MTQEKIPRWKEFLRDATVLITLGGTAATAFGCAPAGAEKPPVPATAPTSPDTPSPESNTPNHSAEIPPTESPTTTSPEAPTASPLETGTSASPDNTSLAPNASPSETQSASAFERPTPDEFLAMSPEQQAELLKTPESALASQGEYTKSIENALNIAYNSHLSYAEYRRIMDELDKSGNGQDENYRAQVVELTIPLVYSVFPNLSNEEEANISGVIDIIATKAAAVYYLKYIADEGLEVNPAALKDIDGLKPYTLELTLTADQPNQPVPTDINVMTITVEMEDSVDDEAEKTIGELAGPIEGLRADETRDRQAWGMNRYDENLRTAYPAARLEPGVSY